MLDADQNKKKTKNNKKYSHKKYARLSTLVVGLMLSMVLSVPRPALAQTAEQRLSEYFQLLADADTPTSPKLIKPVSAFWHKGVHSNWVGVSRYFLMHQPTQWTFGDQLNAGDYMAIQVLFNSRNADLPWVTEFELVKAHSGWKITEFADLTLRPFDEQTGTPPRLVDTYLQQTQLAIENMNTVAEPSEKMRLEKYYGAGAGFWQVSNAVKSRQLMLFLQQKQPESYRIADVEPDVTHADKTAVTVVFEGIKHHPDGYPLQFDVIKQQKRLFISTYYDVNADKRRVDFNRAKGAVTEALDQLNSDMHTAEATVQSQLDILKAAGTGPGLYAAMPDIAEQSKPLWHQSRSAKADLGRLVGLYAGFNGQGAVVPEWALTADGAVVTARLSNAKQLGAITKLLSGVRFTLVQQDGGWKIKHAVILRN